MIEAVSRSLVLKNELSYESGKSVNGFLLARDLALSGGRLPEHVLPRNIDMNFFTQDMRFLYDQQRLDYVMSEGQRKKGYAQLKGCKPTMVGNVLEEIRRDKLERKEAVERGLSKFFDPKTGRIISTPISFGSYRSVRIFGGRELMKQGILSVLEIHTHPYSFPFSFADYNFLMIDQSIGGVGGSIILNPDYQVLAVATTQTPSLTTWEEADLFSKEWRKSFERDYKTERIKLRIKMRVLKEKGYSDERYASLIESCYEAAGKRDFTNLSFLTAQLDEIRKLRERDNDLNDLVVANHNKMVIHGSLEFARTIGLKLYISSDVQNFSAFSA